MIECNMTYCVAHNDAVQKHAASSAVDMSYMHIWGLYVINLTVYQIQPVFKPFYCVGMDTITAKS